MLRTGAGSRAQWLVVCCYLLCAVGLTWRLWADPAGRMVAGNPGDINLFAWFMRYSATAVSHGRLPALVTTGLNAPQGINVMWNTSILLPGVLLAPVTLLAGPQTSLTILLTAGFAGSAASLFLVLRRWGASIIAAALGGAVYGFSPAMFAAAIGHFHLQFAVLPPLIVDAVLRIVTGRGNAVRTGVWLGLLIAAQVFIGEELLVDTAVAAVVIVAVLAVGQPRAVAKQAHAAAIGLATATAVTAVACGYALWVQFVGPLASHGSPWAVSEFRNHVYAFVTPSSSLLFHTSSSAAAAASYPEPQAEYLAYLGWPLFIIAIAAALCFWRDAKVRLATVTFALLELFSIGAVTVKFLGIPFPAALHPWHWLQGMPVLADVLPDRFSILAAGAAGALLAFSLDRARARVPSAFTGRGQGWRHVAAAVVVLAILPLLPVPVPAVNVTQAPAGWQAAFAELRLTSGAHVLVIPDIRLPLRWQAETGEPASIVGGGATIEPNETGQATTYIDHRLSTVQYLYELWQGTPPRRAPSQAQIRTDLAYLQLAAIVTVTGRNSALARFATGEFGQPAVQAGQILAWRLPSRQPSPR